MRRFTPADLPALHEMTLAFGWPYRTEDLVFATGLGEGVAVDVDGVLAGTAFCWRYGAGATVGLVCVRPDRQGQGLGRRLMQAVLELVSERTAVLHATAAGMPLYRSLGFREAGLVWQRQGSPVRPGLIAPRPGERLRPLGRSDPADLAALDRGACGMDRAVLIDALLADSGGVVLDRGDRAVGFALLRRFGRGAVIGPVVAPDREAAQAMVLHLVARRFSSFVRLDVPEESGLSPWLEGLGLGEAYEAFRMERGPALQMDGTRFGLATQALG